MYVYIYTTAWQAVVHRVAQSQTLLKRLSIHIYIYVYICMYVYIEGDLRN